jgi:hypothetical protein
MKNAIIISVSVLNRSKIWEAIAMPFTSYKDIGQVLKEYNITSIQENYIIEAEISIQDYFRAELDYTLKEVSFIGSEYAVCETLIYPILREVSKLYKDKLNLWSHKAIVYDEKLCGTPDYIVAKRSPLGVEIFEKPFLITVEAKKDDFIEGWGQGLAEMVAAQKINDVSDSQTVFGIVANGKLWEFGKLKGTTFTKNIKLYGLADLEKLFGALNYVFHQAELELAAIDATA